MSAQLKNPGGCSTLVITCSDFRLQHAVHAYMEARGLDGDFDQIVRPGAARPLVAPQNDAARASIEEEIALLHRIHGFSSVLVVHHMDCRAYADLSQDRDERAFHAEQTALVAERLAELTPGVTTERLLASFGDDGYVIAPIE
jgi:carbonic anhydrase